MDSIPLFFFVVFLLGDILKIEIKKLKYHLTFFKKNKKVELSVFPLG